MKANQTCNLESCFLCTRCTPSWHLAVANHKQNRKYKKGASIFEEGEKVEGIFFIYTGKIKVHMRWGNEKDLIIRFAQSGDMVGYRGLGNEMVYPVSATALEDVMVCFVDIPFFEATLKVNPELTFELMKFYATELQDAEKRMRNLVHMDVKGRVAETLLMLQNTFGTNLHSVINIMLTKQDIASYAGTTYETFSRTINELIKADIIKVAGKNITILNGQQLKDLASDAQ